MTDERGGRPRRALPRGLAGRDRLPPGRRWSGVLRSRQRRRFRPTIRGQAVRRLPAPSLGEGVRGDRDRPGSSEEDREPPWGKGVGRGSCESRRDLLVHAWRRGHDLFLICCLRPQPLRPGETKDGGRTLPRLVNAWGVLETAICPNETTRGAGRQPSRGRFFEVKSVRDTIEWMKVLEMEVPSQ